MPGAGARIDALLREGRFAEALEALDAWPERTAEQHLLRGRVLGMMGRLDEALEALAAAGELSGSNGPLRAECSIEMVDFTRWSAERSPEQVVETLNDYFGRMAAVVQQSGGTIDKYIGDGMMVLFDDGAPEAELCLQACGCALDMLAMLGEWNRDREQTGRQPLTTRIGIHAGPAVVGNMGSYLEVARSAVGATVNLAARLEALGEPDRILCSDAVKQLANGEMVFAPHGQVEPRGLPPLQAWWLEGRYGRPGRTLVD